jgi:3-dehydroquinate synthase
VVALGGGVIGDLAGFVAATVLRGVPLLQIPTTLLAQVDSSVGGKVGINHPLGKNLIGSFHQPRLVLIDPLVLDTLPMSERWSGASEVVKYALIRDPFFYNLLEKGLEQLIALENMEAVAGMIATCCQIKAEIVERDEKEGGLRRILNFGHTLAHALEAAAGYETFRHGEAVCYGMAWAIQVSKERGLLREEKFRRMDALLKRFPLPPIPETTTAEDLFIRIGLDKKQTAEGLYLVLLEDIGKAKIIPTPGVDLRQSIESILNRQIINL